MMNRDMTFRELQDEQKAWVEHNFPNRTAYQPLLGVCEEVGELCHAHLKQEQKIRGTWQEHQVAKIDAVGDILVYLADYCTANMIDLQSAVELTWQQVVKRDWQKDKLTGGQLSESVTSNIQTYENNQQYVDAYDNGDNRNGD